MITTKVEKNDFKGHPMFSVFEFNEKEEKNFKPVVNLGLKKAKILVKHLKELEHFVASNK